MQCATNAQGITYRKPVFYAISKCKEPMGTTEKLNSRVERKDKEENKLKMTF